MPILRERKTEKEIAEIRKSNNLALSGIRFDSEWLSTQPPVSPERAAETDKLLRGVWSECFLSQAEVTLLRKELGGDIDVNFPTLPKTFCAWSWASQPAAVQTSSMLEI